MVKNLIEFPEANLASPNDLVGDAKEPALFLANIEKEVSPKLKKLFKVALKENPELAKAQFRQFPPIDKYDAGGYFELENNMQGDVVPVLFLSEGKAELLTPLLKIRKESIKINASSLGIDSKEMTPELLQLFIVAHELGHIKDYMVNYEADPDLSAEEAAQEMYFHRDSVLGHLPIPELSPTHLAGELQAETNLQDVIKQYPIIKKHPKFKELKTIEDLLRLQEEEYRMSVPEKYADDFAVDLLKRHADEIDLPMLKSDKKSIKKAA